MKCSASTMRLFSGCTLRMRSPYRLHTGGPLALSFLLVLWPGPVKSGDLQQWSSFAVKHQIDEEFSAGLLSQLRFSDDISRLDVVLLRPDIEYKIAKPVRVALGYDYFDESPSGGQSENRIWQQLRLRYHSGDLLLQNRIRLEERFIEDTDGPTLRLRYRLKIKHPLENPSWQLVSSNETFFNLNHQDNGPDNGFDQNRLFAGIGITLGEHLQMETGYLWKLKASSTDHIIILGFTWNTE